MLRQTSLAKRGIGHHRDHTKNSAGDKISSAFLRMKAPSGAIRASRIATRSRTGGFCTWLRRHFNDAPMRSQASAAWML